MNITYRKAVEGDINNVVSFLDLYLRKDYFVPKSKIRSLICGRHEAAKPDVVWLAFIEKLIVGLCFVSRKGTLWNILVHPDYRNNGIGTELIRLSNPKKIRCKWDMSTGNPAKFYHNLGYGNMGIAIYGGEKGIKTRKPSIQIMIKGGLVRPLNAYNTSAEPKSLFDGER